MQDAVNAEMGCLVAALVAVLCFAVTGLVYKYAHVMTRENMHAVPLDVAVQPAPPPTRSAHGNSASK